MFFIIAMRIAAAPVSGERMKNLIHTSVWRELILVFLAFLARFKKPLMSHLRSEEDGKKRWSLLQGNFQSKDFCHVSILCWETVVDELHVHRRERKFIGAAGKRNLGSRTGNNLMDNFSSVKEKTRVCAAWFYFSYAAEEGMDVREHWCLSSRLAQHSQGTLKPWHGAMS